MYIYIHRYVYTYIYIYIALDPQKSCSSCPFWHWIIGNRGYSTNFGGNGSSENLSNHILSICMDLHMVLALHNVFLFLFLVSFPSQVVALVMH